MDYNLTRRAVFDSTSLHYKVSHKPKQTTILDFDVADNQIFVASKIEIALVSGFQHYSPIPPPGIDGIVKSILQSMGLSVVGCAHQDSPSIRAWLNSICDGKCGSVKAATVAKSYNPYVAVHKDNNYFPLKSGSRFELYAILHGMMFTCISDLPLHVNECIGFAMSSNEVQGKIILDESNADLLYDYIALAGGPDFRRMPFSMESIKQLPECLQHTVLQAISIRTRQQERALEVAQLKALVDSDEGQEALEQMIQDAALADISITPGELKQLCKYLLEAGYRKPQI